MIASAFDCGARLGFGGFDLTVTGFDRAGAIAAGGISSSGNGPVGIAALLLELLLLLDDDDAAAAADDDDDDAAADASTGGCAGMLDPAGPPIALIQRRNLLFM